MKKLYKNLILFINGISKKSVLITKIVNIVKFSVDSTMPEYVLTVVPDKFESELVDNSLRISMKRVCNKYMDWDLSDDCSELDIIERLKKLDKEKRTSFWILLAAEINISVSKNKIQLEHAIVETQKAYSFLKKK